MCGRRKYRVDNNVCPSSLQQTTAASGEREETHGHVGVGAEVHRKSGESSVPFSGNAG